MGIYKEKKNSVSPLFFFSKTIHPVNTYWVACYILVTEPSLWEILEGARARFSHLFRNKSSERAIRTLLTGFTFKRLYLPKPANAILVVVEGGRAEGSVARWETEKQQQPFYFPSLQRIRLDDERHTSNGRRRRSPYLAPELWPLELKHIFLYLMVFKLVFSLQA